MLGRGRLRRQGETGGCGRTKPQPSPTACSYLGSALPWFLCPDRARLGRLWPVSQPWMLVPRRPWPSSFPEGGQSRAGSRSPHILLTPTISVLLVLGHGGPGTGGSEALSPRSLSSWAPGCWQWEALCPRWAQYAQALDVAVALVGRRREEKTDEPSSASQARIHTNISVTPSLPLPTPRA